MGEIEQLLFGYLLTHGQLRRRLWVYFTNSNSFIMAYYSRVLNNYRSMFITEIIGWLCPYFVSYFAILSLWVFLKKYSHVYTMNSVY